MLSMMGDVNRRTVILGTAAVLAVLSTTSFVADGSFGDDPASGSEALEYPDVHLTYDDASSAFAREGPAPTASPRERGRVRTATRPERDAPGNDGSRNQPPGGGDGADEGPADSGGGSGIGNDVGDAVEDAGDKVGGATGGVTDTVDDVVDDVTDTVDDAAGGVDDAVDDVTDAVDSTVDGVTDAVGGGGLTDTVNSTADGVTGTVDAVVDGLLP